MDSITIVPVTPENRSAVLALRVAPGQEGYIETTRECLEEADQLALWRPVALYAGPDLVGFAMYGHFAQYGDRVWLDRLLIDAAYQGKGYGAMALRALVDLLWAEYGRDKIYLSIYGDNALALGMYERFGFRFNGELDTKGERVMVLDLAPCGGTGL